MIETPSFGEASVNNIVEGSNIITYIRNENPLNSKFLFSEAEGFIYGVDSNSQKILLLDISNKVFRDGEAGLHTFDFITINDKTKLIGLTLSSATISKLLYYSCYGIIEYNTGIDKETINLYWKNACSGANFAEKEPNKSNIININEKVC